MSPFIGRSDGRSVGWSVKKVSKTCQKLSKKKFCERRVINIVLLLFPHKSVVYIQDFMKNKLS